jgi:hypothetical protein
MDIDDRPRPKGDLASQLAGESLARIIAHRDRAQAHRAAADALFGKPPPAASAS